MSTPLPATQEQLSRLEDAVERFVTNVGIEFNKLYNSQMRTEAELREFKEEMRQYRDETRADTLAFKKEMSEFKDEMSDYKDENREQIRVMNRQWGQLSNKLGTMVEDLVYPSLTRIIQDVLGLETDRIWVRLKQRLMDGRVKEFDAVALAGDLICLNSTKATLRSSDIDRFVKDIDDFREFFPEYDERPIVGMLATLAIEDSVLNYAEKTGFLALAVGDEIMEVKNGAGFEPKRW